MSKHKVVKLGHNSNRSISEELAKKLKEENIHLNDVARGAVKYIFRYILNVQKIANNLNAINIAKNNWQRGQLVQEAQKNAGKANADAEVFRKVYQPLLKRENLYSPENKSVTMDLVALPAAENFGSYHANSEKELQDELQKIELEYQKEEADDE